MKILILSSFIASIYFSITPKLNSVRNSFSENKLLTDTLKNKASSNLDSLNISITDSIKNNSPLLNFEYNQYLRIESISPEEVELKNLKQNEILKKN